MKLCVVPVNHLLTAVLTAGSACALAGGILPPAALAQSATARAAIAGTHPTWANDSRRISAAHVTSGAVSVRVYLAGQDSAGLSAVAAAVSTPGNALYGHYLSPEEVKARFGPSGGTISAVRAWLTGAGLTVTAVDDRVAGMSTRADRSRPRLRRSALRSGPSPARTKKPTARQSRRRPCPPAWRPTCWPSGDWIQRPTT
jgi:hypothetical protein